MAAGRRAFYGEEMRNLYVSVGALVVLLSAVISADAQTGPGGRATNAPMSQVLVREGDFAFDLVNALKLGTPDSEIDAEDILDSAGIMPRNGWIADYPVTPDILGELSASIVDAAESASLSMNRDSALSTLQDVAAGYALYARVDDSGQDTGEATAPAYPDPGMATNYYSTEGPPVVTYYAPPPDYAYLYSWVSYPFRWSNSWFPGYFMLMDFHTRVRDHRDGSVVVISNHFFDPQTGKTGRIDPSIRPLGGTRTGSSNTLAAGGGRGISPATMGGAGGSRITTSGGGIVTQAPTRTNGQYRGYGVPRPAGGIRSSAFERSTNTHIEENASDRGFQSRSSAGQAPAKAATGGAPRSGGGGFHGADRR